MHQLIVSNNALKMTSIEIAELVGSRHDSVKRTVERLAERRIIQLPPMGISENINGLGLTQKSKHYLFEGERGKRDSIIVVARLCPEFTARFVDRWQELEKQVKQLAAPNTSQAAMDAINSITQAALDAIKAIQQAAIMQPAIEQHTEPVKALPPVGEHHACPTNKISFARMEQYVSNPALRKRLLEEFGLEGELFDPGCVKGTNTPAKPYVVYDRAKVMAVLKATQKLGKNGQEKVLGRKFTVKTVVPVTSYAGDDFDEAYKLLKLLEE